MKKSVFRLLSLIQFFILLGCQNLNSDLSIQKKSIQNVNLLLEDHYQRDLFNGGIIIHKNGKIIYEKYLGLADRTWNIPMAKHVKFDIASLNKSMISALVLKAVEEGKLNLNNKLQDLLKQYTFKGSFHPDITLHQMLCHTSGLPDYNEIKDGLRLNNFLKFKRSRFTNTEYVNFISQIKPINHPGKQFYYSNFAYHIITIILEDVYNKSFPEILKEKLTDPLGLNHTLSLDKNEDIIKQLAKGYNYIDSTDQWIQNPFIDLSLGRRIFSTPSDLNKWAQALNNTTYLSSESLTLMKTNHLNNITKTVSYGYGWVIVDQTNKSTMGDLDINAPYIIHGGSTDGYKAMLIDINNGEFIISFLSNTGDRTNELELAKDIINLLNN